MSVVKETRPEVRLYNTVRKKFLPQKNPYFIADEIKQKASKSMGLSDFGPPDYEQGLEVICEVLNKEAKLHAFGRGLAKAMLIKTLGNRLEIQQRLNEQPEILERKIKKPIFIIGSPRTGTTLLFNLLAQNSNRRWLSTWHSSRPGLDTTDNKAVKSTYKNCQHSIKYIDYMRPNFQHIHETGADLPDECIPLLSSSMCSNMYDIQFIGDTYLQWFREQDLTATYQHYINQLRIMQGDNTENKMWLLKSPLHLSAMSYIHKFFPDATIVQTHRSPTEFIPSNTNLRYEFKALYSYAASRKDIVHEILDNQAFALRTALNDRDQLPLNVVDVYYQDLISDPTKVLEEIYSSANEPEPDNLAATVRTYLERNPQHKRGVHKYSLKDLNLSENEVIQKLDFYLERFNAAVPGPQRVAKEAASVSL